MASLTGQPIQSSYQGVIKTTDNGAIGATEKRVTDGLGNASNMTIGTSGVSFDSGTVDFTGSTVTGLPSGGGVTSIIAGTGISVDQATGDVTVSSSVSDTTYTLDTAQSGSDATITLTGSDASTDVITLAAGSNITLTETGDTITIAAAGGGGGSFNQAFGAYGGNGMKGVIPRNNTPTTSLKTWVTTTGYGTTTQVKDGAAQWALVGLQEGDTISEVHVGITTAQAGATMEVAFYDVDVDSNNNLYIKDRLLSLGTVSAATTGAKIINLATAFTMPAGKVNSQIAILCFPSTTGVGVTNWSQSTWNGAGGDPAGLTVYRAMALNVDPGVAAGTALPASIGPIGTAGIVYGSETSGGLWVMYR